MSRYTKLGLAAMTGVAMAASGRRGRRAKQMVFNQREVDSVRKMARQIEPMFGILRDGAGQKMPPSAYKLYDELEEILLELPYQLEKLARQLEDPGV